MQPLQHIYDTFVVITTCKYYCQLVFDSMIVKKWNTARWNRLIETNRMVVKSCFYEICMAQNWAKRQQIGILRFFYLRLLRHFTFCSILILRHTCLVETWFYYHSIRLDETIPMGCVTFFYDHWMLRNQAKRKMVQ